ncbi:gas vesicle protein GvpG [Laspinema olomoucense]|uniref:gas vesicle protein GvpG n=1 Tax=Laspinema olomoucense TaxID=3231600 RepID=UPI0021BA5701|nr:MULTISPECIES: gas vesicle protein GvpG [unclassified Laspinema]MCT7972500.1 gas vesicle protein GvpG [Laspinema sp. D3d]MCT7988658.1 gas vesicle protein GvpG [Laspinema sp. D3a]MCT7992768.1 gas vesicle protein GvpG [Laspinema sp. D3c]
MLFELLTFPISGPLGGIVWLGEQLLERATSELDDIQNVQKQLLALQLAFDMGDISEEDFEIQEEELLLRIQAMEEEIEAEQSEEREPEEFISEDGLSSFSITVLD